jgi:predicted HicB family RNase H-like nuclease
MLTYKGYTAEIREDVDAGIFHGQVLNIKDVVTFEGRTPEEAQLEFYRSVDAYLTFCQEIGQEPNQPTPE